MATHNKEQKQKRLEEIARSHAFLADFVEADEPTQYPTAERSWGMDHKVQLASSDLRDKLARDIDMDDVTPLTMLAYGQLLRKNAHRLLDNQFPLNEEDSLDYTFVNEDRARSFHSIRYDLSSLHSSLHMYLKDKGADFRDLRELEVKPQALYATLRKKGFDSHTARERIRSNERLSHINTTYPTIDDVEATWKDFQSSINTLESQGSNPESVKTAIRAGHEYMDTIRRLHDFNKY